MEPYSPKQIERGRWLFSGDCQFKIGAANFTQIPESPIDEIAFVGRSNVGKSSLMNALTGRNTLARVSHTPGRTKQINFFSLRDLIMLVDLPGYGYAKASKKEVKGWNNLIIMYLRGRPNLRRVCLLIDARHGLKDSDREIMHLLDDVAVNYQIVLTKCDKVKKADEEKIISSITSNVGQYPALHPEIIATSSHKKLGVEDLRAALALFVDEGQTV